MKLGMLIRDPKDAQSDLAKWLRISHFVLNLHAGPTLQPIEFARTSVYVPSLMLTTRHVGKVLGSMDELAASLTARKFYSIILDVGNAIRFGHKAARQFSDYLLKHQPACRIGICAPLSILVTRKQELAEMFYEKNFFPLAVLGSGSTVVENELFALRGEYQNAVPVVLTLSPNTRANIGRLLSEHWAHFSELIFWSPLTLAGVDYKEVAKELAPKFLEESQLFVARESTHIRLSPSLSSKTNGETIPGETYRIVELVSNDALTHFGKLENGTYVVFDEAKFTQKE